MPNSRPTSDPADVIRSKGLNDNVGAALEFLVNEMGFNLFAMEATMPESFDVNEYVLTGRGDPTKALAGIYFWTWYTEEVLDMVKWMRAYNADPKHRTKVKFYGFDMQAPARAAKVTLS